MASEQGDADCQVMAGVNYAEGVGVAQNWEQAVFWYEKSAEQGIEGAQLNLGTCYYHGRGAPQDYKVAIKWWSKAADQGNVKAQNILHDLGVPSKQPKISLIKCDACENKVSESAKFCPKCGHPVDSRNLVQKTFDVASEIPTKVVQREGIDPNVKRGGKSKIFFFVWIPFFVCAVIAIPDPIGIIGGIAFTAFLWWAIGKDAKPR